MESVFLTVNRLLVLGLSTCLVLGGEEMRSGMRVIYSAYKQCEQDVDPLVCLKARAVKLMDRAITSDTISVMDGEYGYADYT